MQTNLASLQAHQAAGTTGNRAPNAHSKLICYNVPEKSEAQGQPNIDPSSKARSMSYLALRPKAFLVSL